MTRALDLLLAFALGLALGAAPLVWADAPRWSAASAVVMWTHATSGPVEADTTNPLPVKGY